MFFSSRASKVYKVQTHSCHSCVACPDPPLLLPLQTMEVTSLEVLEALMTEFFAPDTSNARKHQIEKVLEEFGRRPDAWKNCLLCISGTSNPYVSMFCMTSLEVSAAEFRTLGGKVSLTENVYIL